MSLDKDMHMKQSFYDPFARFAHRIREEADQPELPSGLEWLTGKVHPLVIAALFNFLHADGYVVAEGRSSEGIFFSMYGEDGDEILRLTAHIERTGQTSGWLGDRRTDQSGIWIPGGESFETPTFALSNYEDDSTPFQDLRNVLKAVQVFGEDNDLDVQHRGTYIEHSLLRPSRVTEHYLFGGQVMTLTHRPKHHQVDPVVQTLTMHMEDEFSDLRDIVVVRTHRGLDRLDAAHFFPSQGSRDGETQEEDVFFAVMQLRHQPNLDDAQLQEKRRVAEETLRSFVEDDDNLGTVANRLLSLRSRYQFIEVQQESASGYCCIYLSACGQSAVTHLIKVK